MAGRRSLGEHLEIPHLKEAGQRKISELATGNPKIHKGESVILKKPNDPRKKPITVSHPNPIIKNTSIAQPA